MEITKSGVLITPAIIIEGDVKVAGKIPDIEEVMSWIEDYESVS